MRKDIFRCNFDDVLRCLNNCERSILTACDLADMGLVSDASRCYELVRLGKLPIYERDRKHMWFHRDHIIEYVIDLMKSRVRK